MFRFHLATCALDLRTTEVEPGKPYARFERLNTQDRVPEGFEANPKNARSILSLGAAWKPIPNFILKTDYQIHWNDANTGINQFNIALGYVF